MLVVLHANWHQGSLHVWGESAHRFVLLPDRGTGDDAVEGGGTAVAIDKITDRAAHSYAVDSSELRELLTTLCGVSNDLIEDAQDIDLRLPRDLLGPWPSDRLGNAVGGIDGMQDAWLGSFSIPTVRLSVDDPIIGLLALERCRRIAGVEFGHSIPWFISVARFVLELMADQRFIPSLHRRDDGHLSGMWRPWLLDEEIGPHISSFMRSMPPVVRGVTDSDGDPWTLFESVTGDMVERSIRRILIEDDFSDSLEDRSLEDPHVAWLHGLLQDKGDLPVNGELGQALFLDARRWISRLDEVDRNRALRGCFLLEAPDASEVGGTWKLAIGLETNENPPERILAEEIWQQTRDVLRLSGNEDLDPQELLITELGRAARLYPKLEPLLNERMPEGVVLKTNEVSDACASSRSGKRPKWRSTTRTEPLICKRSSQKVVMLIRSRKSIWH